MSRRLIAVVTPDVANGREVKVYHDTEWGEYRARLVVDGLVAPAADYFTDDQADAIATADAYLNNAGLRTYSDMHQGAADLYLAAHAVCTGPLKRRPTHMDALRAACTAFAPALPLTSDVLLTLTVWQARELRECIDADVMDLSTVALDDEDAAKVAVLRTVLARLDALLAGVA